MTVPQGGQPQRARPQPPEWLAGALHWNICRDGAHPDHCFETFLQAS
ncbi:hypothetical protein [Streptomyces sp. NPDC002078]